jgi:hypothetical protein
MRDGCIQTPLYCHWICRSVIHAALLVRGGTF